MSVVKLVTTILSGTTNVNILQGRREEYLSRAAAIRIFMVQQIVTTSNIDVDFTLGNVVVGDDLRPNTQVVAAGESPSPRLNEDLLAQDIGAGGDRIQIRARETTGIVAANGILGTQIFIDDI